uniref:Uncharacterized protein n=1 Tax=Myoviridae sp. ctKZW4 TaxID=2826639 RepID=A0A8S5NAR4_9CAUD|nr:MAG TPA: hypothetical protein [Myoviridae sp. ctKZW4]DAU22276.1 MAG TPA: hypothetical protein [Caudoviricetes sp.]
MPIFSADCFKDSETFIQTYNKIQRQKTNDL